MEGPVDLPERQRTLRAAIDWSYRRLTERQQQLHGTLAAFSDGAALDDARAVAPDTPPFSPTWRHSSAGASSGARPATVGFPALDARDGSRACALPARAGGRAGPGARSACGSLSRGRLGRGARALGSRAGAVARPARARVRQPQRCSRLAPVVWPGGGRAPRRQRARTLLAGSRPRERSAPLACARPRARHGRLPPTPARTRCGPPLDRRRVRATGTPLFRCSRKRSRCFGCGSDTEKRCLPFPSSASSPFVAATRSGRRCCATRRCRSHVSSATPARPQPRS